MWHLVTLLVGIIVVPADVHCVRTNNTRWPEYKIFYPIEDNTIRFDVWAGHDAWIAFTSVPYPTAPKLEVLLGSYGNTKVQILQNRTYTLAQKDLTVLNFNDYRGFWIKFENRNKSPGSEIIRYYELFVGREGESKPFITSVQHQYFKINYFALATTGADKSGYWKLKGIEENSGILVDTNKTNVITNSSKGFPIYTKFYKLTDNVVRFKIKTLHYAWIRFTPARSTFPSYEVVIGAANNGEVIVYKDRNIVSTVYGSFLDENNFKGFWIDFTPTKDYYGYKHVVICVGHLGAQEYILKYTDTSPYFVANYFSIATTSDGTKRYGYWELHNVWPY